MERVLKMWYVVCILLLTFVQSPVHGEQQVPCYFIFGDSLVDNGNNNGIATMAKANYPPYGIDFPNGPTGRFCNGRTMADFIGDLKSLTLGIVTPHNTKDAFAELLGFDNILIPSYATTRGQDILKGVNYASGAAGIRSESGQQMGARISMGEQLQNHLITITRIADIFRDKNVTGNYLSKCIYSVGMGNNDYINNYFMPQYYPTSRLYTPEQYANVLIKQYSQQLRALYKLGARKVALFGLGQIGCAPFEISRYGTNGSSCVDFINNAVQLFNNRLKSLVDGLNNILSGAKFIYVNVFGMASGDASSVAEKMEMKVELSSGLFADMNSRRERSAVLAPASLGLGGSRQTQAEIGKPRPRSNRQPPRTTPRSRSEPVTNHHAEIEIGARITNKPNGEQREQRSFGSFGRAEEKENEMKREKEIG
uniref:GDSL esterase/lipase n=1 Tax=Fagus sylvatica TaxID=28930 RepID=A0A2N9HZN5_FAGSY